MALSSWATSLTISLWREITGGLLSCVVAQQELLLCYYSNYYPHDQSWIIKLKIMSHIMKLFSNDLNTRNLWLQLKIASVQLEKLEGKKAHLNKSETNVNFRGELTTVANTSFWSFSCKRITTSVSSTAWMSAGRKTLLSINTSSWHFAEEDGLPACLPYFALSATVNLQVMTWKYVVVPVL